MYHKVKSLGHLHLWSTLGTFLQRSNNITSTTICTLTTRSSQLILPSHASPMYSRSSRTTLQAEINDVPTSDSSLIQRNLKSSGTERSRAFVVYRAWTSDYTDIITPVDVVRDLGVLFNTKLTMKKHISKITNVCFYHLRLLNQVRRLLGLDITARLVSAFVLSRLDYCNFVLAGLPQSTIAPLQGVQNAAARLIVSLGSRDHITPALRQFHWLSVHTNFAY